MADRYWVGGTGNWSDNATHWSDSSNGSPGASKPTSSDSVYFDASSFSGTGEVVTVDENSSCLNMTWTGALHSPTISGSYSLSISGNTTFISAMTCGVANIIMLGNSKVFAGEGLSFGILDLRGNPVTISGSNTIARLIVSTYVVVNFTVSTTQTITEINSNNTTFQSTSSGSPATITKASGEYIIVGSNIKDMTFGATCYVANGSNVSGNTGITFDAQLGTIISTLVNRVLDLDSRTYSVVDVRNSSTIVGSNTIASLLLTAGKTYTFTAGSTQLVQNITANGALGTLITIQSSSSGSPFTISRVIGKQRFSYCSIKDTTASGGAEFRASNCTGVSGNTGITFLSTPDQSFGSLVTDRTVGFLDDLTTTTKLSIVDSINEIVSDMDVLPALNYSASTTLNTTGTGNIADFKVNGTIKTSIDKEGHFIDPSADLLLQPQGENIVGFGYEPCGGVLRMDDDDPRIIYSPGDWVRYGGSNTFIQEGINNTLWMQTKTIGASFSFSYVGTNAYIVTHTATDKAQLSVSVDGGTPSIIDLYNAAYTSFHPILVASESFGFHTVCIEVVGKNILATDSYMTLMSIEVIQTTTSSLTLALDGERDKSSALVDGNRITSLSDITSTIPEITQLCPNANLLRESPTMGTVFSDNFERDDGPALNGWSAGTISSNKYLTVTGAYTGATHASFPGEYPGDFKLLFSHSNVGTGGGLQISSHLDINNSIIAEVNFLGINLIKRVNGSQTDLNVAPSPNFTSLGVFGVFKRTGNIYYYRVAKTVGHQETGGTINVDYVEAYVYCDSFKSSNIRVGCDGGGKLLDDVVVTAPVPYGWAQAAPVGSISSYVENTFKAVNSIINTNTYAFMADIVVTADNSYTFKILRKLSSFTSGSGAGIILRWKDSTKTVISDSGSETVTSVSSTFVEATLTATSPSLSCYVDIFIVFNGIGTCEWKEPLFELTSTATGIFHLKEFRSDLISLDNTGSVVRTQGYEDEIGYRVVATTGAVDKFYRPKETVHHWDRVKTWYTNGWTQDILSGVPRIYTGTLNEALYVSFVGTGLSFTLSQSLTRGIVGVSVDGGTEFLVDQYNASTVKVVSNLPYGQHTVKFRITATMSITGAYVCLFSYFDIYVPKIPTLPANNVQISATIKADPDHGWIRYEENEGVVYSGTWVDGIHPSYSVNTAKWTITLDSYAEYSFIGNAIRWIGVKGSSSGIAEVFMDICAGYVSKGNVDLYNATGIYGSVQYTQLADLPIGLNKLKLVNTHTKNASSDNYYVVLDAFEIKNSLYVTDLRNQVLSKDDVDTLFRNHLELVNPHLITASMLSAPTYTTAALTYYVDVVNGSDMNSGTSALPFKTITYALSLVPKNLKHAVIIRVCAGNYEAEGQIVIQGFFGEGGLYLLAWNGASDVSAYTDATNYELNSVAVTACSNKEVYVSGFEFKIASASSLCVAVLNCATQVTVQHCDSEVTCATGRGVSVSASNCMVDRCRFSNKDIGLLSAGVGSFLVSSTTYGSGNNYGLFANFGGVIAKYVTTNTTGTTPEAISAGGRMFQQASPFKSIRFTRDLSAVSGDVSYTGFSMRGRMLIILGGIRTGGVPASIGMQIGSDEAACLYNYHNVTANNWVQDAIVAQAVVSAADYQKAVLKSWDADGFTLTWTKYGNPTGLFYVTAFVLGS